MNPAPVFIVGSPRSGTSLLRQMLDRHPRLAICYETDFLRLIYTEERRKVFGDLNSRSNRERLVHEYIKLRPTQRLGVDTAQLAARLFEEGTSYPAFFACVLRFYAESQGKQRSGDKTPGHAFFVETLCEWFPGAPILHIVRDPRDVVASLHRTPFGSPSTIINARTWLRHNLAARRIRDRPQYLEVRYETLVMQPEEELKRICEFIGEDYSPSLLTPEQSSSAHPDGWDRYQAPLTTARLGSWRHKLTAKQVAQIEWAIGPHLEDFGYAREGPRASTMAILAARGFAKLSFAQRLIARAPALWYRLFAPRDIAKYEYWTRRKMWMNDEPPSRAASR